MHFFILYVTSLPAWAMVSVTFLNAPYVDNFELDHVEYHCSILADVSGLVQSRWARVWGCVG